MRLLTVWAVAERRIFPGCSPAPCRHSFQRARGAVAARRHSSRARLR